MTPPAARAARDVLASRGCPERSCSSPRRSWRCSVAPSVSIWTDEAVTISAATRSFERALGAPPADRRGARPVLRGHGASGRTSSASHRSPCASRARWPPAPARSAPTRSPALSPRRRRRCWRGLLTATIPRITWGGIEARPFIFSAVAAVWATFLLLRALQRRTRGAWVAYTVVAVLGILTNIYLVMVVAAHVLTVLLRARRDRFSARRRAAERGRRGPGLAPAPPPRPVAAGAAGRRGRPQCPQHPAEDPRQPVVPRRDAGRRFGAGVVRCGVAGRRRGGGAPRADGDRARRPPARRTPATGRPTSSRRRCRG